MGHEVYANNRSIASKTADGASRAAFPDVCWSPPPPSAGPLPTPYPNSVFARDIANGSKTVFIGGKEIAQRNKSWFATSTGDEGATPSLGRGIVSQQIKGRAFFTSWSMDVMVEGFNVCRHLDLVTHNHMG